MKNRTLAIGLLILFVLIGATGGGIFYVKMNKPIEQHVPFLLSEIPEEGRIGMVDQWATLADSEEVLLAVVKTDGIMEGLGASSEQEAIVMVRDRTRVDLGSDGATMRTLAKGIRKEMDMLNKLAIAVFDETKNAYVKRNMPASRTSSQ